MVAPRFSHGDMLVLVAVLAVFGAVDSAYLTWQWFDASNSTWCDLDAYFSCTKVRESPFSSLASIPTAVVGVVGFGVLLALAVLALRGVERVGPVSTTQWLFLFAILGGLAGLGLTVVEIFVIQAICVLCAVGFGLDLAILAAAAILRRPGIGG